MTFEEYIKKIEADYRRGNATEYTYRGSIELLIESCGKGVDASSDPKHISCGAPDFIVEKRKVPLGYIETKDVGADLDKVEKSDQMKRYLKALHNLILTDYVEFRWYVNGVRKLKFRAADFGKNSKLLLHPDASKTMDRLFADFLATEVPTVATPRELAERLANVTQFIRDQIGNALESGDPDLQKVLNQQYKTFVDLLLPELKPREFADLYAQAITYGLFAAKLSAPPGAAFEFEDAYKYLRANPFLRRLFLDVNEQLDEMDIIQPYLKDLVSLLNRAHFDEILADFGKRTRTEDPVVHFYETFLATYDPKLRESRGVYYTPEPVVQFIVRSVDEILKTRFNKPWGLADESVKVLDPATGTGTFLYYVIQQIYDEIVNQRGQGGQWAEKSKEMLKRLYGFELLIAPYVVSHLKLGLLMQSLGAPLEGKDDRLHIYLTNALEEGIERADMLAGLGLNIAEESSEAAKVKKADDIMVVLGNPPYSGHSANASVDKEGNPNFIGKLLREYFFVDGIPLGERNSKWLQDDYVKFLRYAEYRINKSGKGMIAFITNHGYIDNPTFRGMRQHLLTNFDEIYILDLHGNTKKKEKTPTGEKDENVFDIVQGVAIILAIKYENRTNNKRFVHTDFWGLRSQKYINLQNSFINKISWHELHPESPFYLLAPRNKVLNPEYDKFWRIKEIFKFDVPGIFTARDELTIHMSPTEVWKTINEFVVMPIEDARAKFNLGPDVRDWKVHLAQKDILDSKIEKSKIIEIQYRPFDKRFTYYTGRTKGFHCMPRYENMRSMLTNNNIALGIGRQGAAVSSDEWNLITCFTCIPDLNGFRRGGVQAFPLYLLTTPESTKGMLFPQSEMIKDPNFHKPFITEFCKRLSLDFVNIGQGDLKTTFGPEDVFYYAYAVFHSPTYRTRYAEFLKIDFPRLPLTSDKKLFAVLVAKGKQLVELHLLKSPVVEDFITTYPVAGENRVEKITYSDGKVFINPDQYFGGLPAEVWNFKIGGYQVCDKWLKDRKGRVLTGEDKSHYQRVVVSLQETIRLMKEIDQAIPKWPMV